MCLGLALLDLFWYFKILAFSEGMNIYDTKNNLFFFKFNLKTGIIKIN